MSQDELERNVSISIKRFSYKCFEHNQTDFFHWTSQSNLAGGEGGMILCLVFLTLVLNASLICVMTLQQLISKDMLIANNTAQFSRKQPSVFHSCLTFPTGTAQTQSKHHSMMGWKGMNTPYLPFCGWELFLVGQAQGCAIGMPILSHTPKT